MTRVAQAGAKLDDESKAILYDGANMSQLAELFKVGHRELQKHIHKVQPCGKRGGADIYRVHEVAPFIVKPVMEIAEYIKNMHHTDLPVLVRKEYWAAKRSQQLFELAAGDLWPTDKVIEKVGELFKLFKTSARLAGDSVERQVEMTTRQRDIIKKHLDSMMENCRREVIKNFTAKPVAAPAKEVADVDGSL